MLAQAGRAQSDQASLTEHLKEERVRSFGAHPGFDIKGAVKGDGIDRVGVHAQEQDNALLLCLRQGGEVLVADDHQRVLLFIPTNTILSRDRDTAVRALAGVLQGGPALGMQIVEAQLPEGGGSVKFHWYCEEIADEGILPIGLHGVLHSSHVIARVMPVRIMSCLTHFLHTLPMPAAVSS